MLDRKLQLLAEYADFHVNINSVLDSAIRHPDDALEVTRRALRYGLATTVGIIHDSSGQLRALSATRRGIFQ